MYYLNSANASKNGKTVSTQSQLKNVKEIFSLFPWKWYTTDSSRGHKQSQDIIAQNQDLKNVYVG